MRKRREIGLSRRSEAWTVTRRKVGSRTQFKANFSDGRLLLATGIIQGRGKVSNCTGWVPGRCPVGVR